MNNDNKNNQNNNTTHRERNWSDVNPQGSGQNRDQGHSDPNKTEQSEKLDRKREGQGNEIIGSSEHLSPKSEGQETNPKGRM